MRVLLLGPPGSGKGTQASALQQRWGIPHISSGDLLRAHVRDDTELGLRAKSYMDRGELVPDDLILDMMASRLSEADAQQGFALDGFPRTVAQAEALDRRLQQARQQLDAVVYLDVPEPELLRRLGGRRTCPRCNAVYHVETMPPQREGSCDRCGADLIQREDERPDVVRRRLQVYLKQTEPLLAYYQQKALLHRVDGTIGVARVLEAIRDIVEPVGKVGGEG
jgi:adenylate kinase